MHCPYCGVWCAKSECVPCKWDSVNGRQEILPLEPPLAVVLEPANPAQEPNPEDFAKITKKRVK